MSHIRNISRQFLVEWRLDDPLNSYDAQIEKRLAKEGEPLSWAVVNASPWGKKKIRVTVEAALLISENVPAKKIFPELSEIFLQFKFRADSEKLRKEFVPFPKSAPIILHIVPTGTAAWNGGSLGDAMPANSAFSRIGFLLTHPNTCNGGILNNINDSMLYVADGYALDLWARGFISFARPRINRIGVTIDRCSGDNWVITQARNIVKGGILAHSGGFLAGTAITEKPAGGVARRNKSGAFGGEVKNIKTVLEAAEYLKEDLGADAIAIFTWIRVDHGDWARYMRGAIIKSGNPLGKTESYFSHAVVRRLGIPAAHAPLVYRQEERALQSHGEVRPEAGLEAGAPLYLPSVLRGLQFAPRFYRAGTDSCSNGYLLSFENLTAIVCPASTMGGIPMMRAEAAGKPIIGIKQNSTVLQVFPENLRYRNAILVEDYLEAIGLLQIAKNANDFSVKTLRRILAEQRDVLRQTAEEVCLSAYPAINPVALLRPLMGVTVKN